MSSHRTRLTFLAFAPALLTLTLFAACGGGDDDDVEPPADEATATVEDAIRTPDGTGAPDASPTPGVPPTPPSEAGEAPIFYATEDGFESLQAGEPYKVRFRITSGYEEETLRIVAESEATGETIDFEALRAEPVGEEEPGTYYPFNLELPEPGMWEVTVVAGDDQVTIPVDVGSPTGPSSQY